MLNTLSVIGDLGRCIIRAAPGCRFLAADYSGVESRGTAWIAGEQHKINQWARFDATGDPKDEPYYQLGIKFGLPQEKARAIGKVCDLAFGYMGSVGAYRALDPHTALTDDQIKELRDRWRKEHPQIVRFWKLLMRTSAHAMRRPSATIPCGRVSFTYDGETFLRMRLPSGRDLAYPMPRLITDPMYGEVTIIFKDNAKGKFVDCRDGRGAYGGTWIENAVQALARDVFTEAMQRLEAAGYPVVMHVHDEIVCELPIGVGTKEEFHKIMTAAPAWAAGLPIAAKAHNSTRFAKMAEGRESIKEQDASPHANGPALVRQPETNSTPEPEILQSFSQTPPEGEEEVIMETPISDPPSPDKGPDTPHIEDAPPTASGFDADSAQTWSDWFRKKANGRRRTDGYPHGEDEPAGSKQAAEFVYKAADGAEVLKVRKIEIFNSAGVRIEKRFPQRFKVNGQWVSKKPAGWVPIPYRLPELLAASPDAVIDVFEGEKDADRGAALGLIATCNPEGAGKWCDELNEHFRGRRVRIHEDNDDAGRKLHVPKVVASLRGIAKESRIVSYPEVPPGEDFSWFMDHGGTIEAMIARAKPTDPRAKLLLSSAEFVAGFEPPDYLIVGWLQRRFVYSLTAATGAGKTAIALQLVLLVSRAKMLGGQEVKRGSVLYFAGENPDDVRMRWIATTAAAELTPEDIDNVHFMPGTTLLSKSIEEIRTELATHELALVVVDTSAAFFEGDDENNNTQALAHAKRMRALSELPGGPTVLVCSHPTKNAETLLPRGGGAFLNETDGNLTAVREDLTVQVHWQGKFRGPEFAPIDFRLEVVTHPRLHDKDNNPIRTVIAQHLDEVGLKQMKADSRLDQDVVLLSIEQNSEMTQRERARELNWVMKSGEPYQMRVARAESALTRSGLIKLHRGRWELTDKGIKEIKRIKKTPA